MEVKVKNTTYQEDLKLNENQRQSVGAKAKMTEMSELSDKMLKQPCLECFYEK